MSASLALLALAAQQIVVPLGRAQRAERLPAPIATAGPDFARACPPQEQADRPAPPVRIHGNSFYVGSCRRSAVLITGGRFGHVLIDSGTERSAGWIVESIRQLGFRPEDIRLLLHSNAHPDQVGGLSRLQRLSGGQVVASAPSVAGLRSGRLEGMAPGAAPIAQVPVDRVIAHGGEVRLGGILLTALATAGRTPGGLSWRWVACEGAVCRTIVYAAGLRPLSAIQGQAREAAEKAGQASAARIAALEPCDILVSADPRAAKLPERFGRGQALSGAGQCAAYARTQSGAPAAAQGESPPR